MALVPPAGGEGGGGYDGRTPVRIQADPLDREEVLAFASLEL